MLADRERIAGADHPDTMAARSDLAFAYRSAGQLREAVPAYERALADRERVLGPSHPETLTSYGNLAHAYLDAGRVDAGIGLFERTLTDREWEGLDLLRAGASTKEIADALLFLEGAPFVTGEILHLDGGAHAGRW